MKALTLILVSFLSLNAIAAPSREDIERGALEVLLANADSFADHKFERLPILLSEMLLTQEKVKIEITNRCKHIRNDEFVECRLKITRTDDSTSKRKMSSDTITYQLSLRLDGMPSELFLNPEVKIDHEE